MKPEQLREELETLSEKLDITVRYESGDFKGGRCQVNDRNIIIIPKQLPVEKQVRILCRELAQFPLENMFILPVVRKLLDEYKLIPEQMSPVNEEIPREVKNKKTDIQTSQD